MTQCKNSHEKFIFRKYTSDPYFFPFTVIFFPFSFKYLFLLFKQRFLFIHFQHKNSKQKFCSSSFLKNRIFWKIQYSLWKPTYSHWFKNVLLALFSLQLCLFFFHKMMKFYKEICSAWISRASAKSIFSPDWRHRCRKNTTEISSIYWNVLLWIFSNWIRIIITKNYFSQPNKKLTHKIKKT